MVKVSVIIPVYNTEKYLAECLSSILNQTLRNIEVICVNDGSTDQSGKILEAYKKSDSRLAVIHQKNGGQSAARNTGMKYAKGEYVYFMDSDDRLNTDALQMLYEESKKQRLDVLYFEGSSFWETKKLRKSHSEMRHDCDRGGLSLPVLSGQEMFTEFVFRKKYLVSVCLQFLRRSFLNEAGITFLEGILHEDNLFTFQVMMNAGRTECLNLKLFDRRIRQGSTMTKKPDYYNCRGYYVCCLEILKYALNHQKESGCALQRSLAEVLKELFYSVKRTYGKLQKQQKMQMIKHCTPIEKYIFCIWVLPPGAMHRIRRLLKNKGLGGTIGITAARIAERVRG